MIDLLIDISSLISYLLNKLYLEYASLIQALHSQELKHTVLRSRVCCLNALSIKWMRFFERKPSSYWGTQLIHCDSAFSAFRYRRICY